MRPGTCWTFHYAAGVDDAIGRLSSLANPAGTLETYQYLGLGTVVVRAHPQPDLTLTLVDTPGDGGDQYAGLDRFGRVVDQRWVSTGTSTVLGRVHVQLRHGGQPADPRQWRELGVQ